MENLIFLFHFLRLTLLHYIYPNPRLSFHFFILFWLLCAFYYCKSLLPTIGRLDPRVPPDSVLLHSTVKLAPLRLMSWSGVFLSSIILWPRPPSPVLGVSVFLCIGHLFFFFVLLKC